MIRVYYHCKGCMPARSEEFKLEEFQPVTVRSRAVGEDVVAFTREVTRLISLAHENRGCAVTEADIVIPSDEKGIGF